MRAATNRRRFVAGLAGTSATLLAGGAPSFADEAPPETTTVRLPKNGNICFAPLCIAEELLRAEGFTDVRFVSTPGGFTFPELVARKQIDFGASFAGAVVFHLDAGVPFTTLAGLHSGCYELFVHEPVRTIADLKGKRVAITTLTSSAHLYLSIIAAHVGLDPTRDIAWVTSSDVPPIELFAAGETDAFLGFPPEPQELRARKVGRVILSTAADKPWSQYFCCMVFSSRDFVAAYPVATKRALRAILKAADFCAAAPEVAARQLVDGGFAERYDYALQTVREVPYDRWREYDPEDTVRFYSLRLQEIGMIKSTPDKIIAQGTDWRFLNEIKYELKL